MTSSTANIPFKVSEEEWSMISLKETTKPTKIVNSLEWYDIKNPELLDSNTWDKECHDMNIIKGIMSRQTTLNSITSKYSGNNTIRPRFVNIEGAKKRRGIVKAIINEALKIKPKNTDVLGS